MSRTYNDPHLMHVTMDYDDGSTHFRLECPHDGVLGATCNPWVECSEHERPDEPDMPEPRMIPGSMDGDYEPDSDPDAVKAWDAYWKAEEEFEELHVDGPDGAYHPEKGCWLQHFVSEMRCGDGWHFDKSVDGIEIVSPLKVDYYDDGCSYDEPVPVFTLWKPHGE